MKKPSVYILISATFIILTGMLVAHPLGGRADPAGGGKSPSHLAQNVADQGEGKVSVDELSDTDRLSGIVDPERSKVNDQILFEKFGGIDQAAKTAKEQSAGCLTCHEGVEQIHVGFPLGCAFCHGGNPTIKLPASESKSKPYSQRYKEILNKAHVHPSQPLIADRRVLPMDYDLPYQQFLNPTNLRVTNGVCGMCHVKIVTDFAKSLHSHNAGHYNGGLYLNGVTDSKVARYGVIEVEDTDGYIPPDGLKKIETLPALDPEHANLTDVAELYKDVPRKQCTACHLWSKGTGVKGRLGLDGNYRAEGCAACHVTYAENGLSQSSDPTIDHFEPGHPITHRFTSAIPTTTCTHCHFRGARIGLNFRGLAQLPPGVPAGPTVKGTTDYQINGAFYLKDSNINPPDLHHERGMHCIDCHTLTDVMGDGNIYGTKEFAIEIECEDCHGTLDKEADLFGSRGTLLRNLRRESDGRLTLTSKVDGKEHPVKQIKHILDSEHSDYNPRAAKAMTKQHLKKAGEGGLECYACHNSWVMSCFGCHYQWNGQFTQLDMISGERTKGQTQMNEFVYTNYRPFYIGINSESEGSKTAPYNVGCYVMTTAVDEKGNQLLDLKLPRTAAGLSGLSMNPRQPHTVTNKPRQCADCHRSAQAVGLGSENFRIFRTYVFAVSDRGLNVIEVAGNNRKNINMSRVVATLPLTDARGIKVTSHFITADAEYAYVADGRAGLRVIDLFDPKSPQIIATVPTDNALDVAITAKYAYVADGASGIRIVDISTPEAPILINTVPTTDARSINISGIHAYVADGAGGLRIIDVSEPMTAQIVGSADLNGEADAAPHDAHDLVVAMDFSTPDIANNRRTPARLCAYVADGAGGLRIVDVTEPSQPTLIASVGVGQNGYCKGVDFITIYELGSFAGSIPSVERDYIVMAVHQRDFQRNGYVQGVDVTDPAQPRVVANDFLNQNREFNRVTVGTTFLAPFLYQYAFIAAESGGLIVENITDRRNWDVAANFGIGRVRDIALEVMPLDRTVDEEGRQLKDTAHIGARPYTKAELYRILRAPIEYPYRYDVSVTKVNE